MGFLLKKPGFLFLVLSIFVSVTSVVDTMTSAIIYTIAVISIIYSLGFNPLGRKNVYWFLGFCVIMLVYSVFGRGSLNTSSMRGYLFSFIMILSVFVFSYYIKKINEDETFALLIVFLLFLTYSIVGTTLVSFINPMAIRKYGHGVLFESGLMDMSDVLQYRSMGMMSYSLAHAMALVSTGLSALICFSHKKWIRIVSVILLFLVIRLLFVMVITTAMLISAISVTLIFSYRFSKGNVSSTILLFVLFLAVFFMAGISSFILDVSDKTNSVLAAKLNDLFYSVETGTAEGQTGYRKDLYFASISTFIHNPIFGWGTDDGSRTIVGGHSYILDYFAYYGIFALFFFLPLWREYKMNGACLNDKLRRCYYFSFIPVVCMFLLKARSVCLCFPFMSLVFLQVLFLYLQSEQKEV